MAEQVKDDDLFYGFSPDGQFWYNALRPQSGGWLYLIYVGIREKFLTYSKQL